MTTAAIGDIADKIPIVFELVGDPVKFGLVASLNRPGGNLTGVALFANVIDSKRVEFLSNLLPNAKTIALLVNDPNNPVWKSDVRQVEEAAHSFRISVEVLTARAKDEIDSAFASLPHSNAGGLIVVPSPLFLASRDRIVSLAARYAVPAVYPFPSFPKAGGLMSYGDDLADAFRQVGNYAAELSKVRIRPIFQSSNRVSSSW